jgi:hypothetical protein
MPLDAEDGIEMVDTCAGTSTVCTPRWACPFSLTRAPLHVRVAVWALHPLQSGEARTHGRFRVRIAGRSGARIGLADSRPGEQRVGTVTRDHPDRG